MEDSQASKSSSSFSRILAKRPSISEPVKAKKQRSSRTTNNGHEEIEEDPSPHAQHPASITSIVSDFDEELTPFTDDDNDLEYESLRSASKIKLESIPTSDGEEAHIPIKAAGIRSLSSLPAHDTAEVNPSQDDYMSDDDLIEEDAKIAKGYSDLSASDKRAWESKRAEAFFRAGHAKHFECSIHLLGEQQCTTHQEYYPSRCAARPVVSCFFGHNKNEWNQIVKSVRVMLCRKCYQRLDHKLQPHLACIQLPVCRELVNKLERWRPDCQFNIKLTKAMQAKVDRFEGELASSKLSRQRLAKTIDTNAPHRKSADISRAENTPVLFAIELQDRFEGINKTSNDVHALLDWLAVKLADGTIEDLPAFEALLELSTQDEEKLLVQQRRRAALKKSRRTSAPADKKTRRSRKMSKAKFQSVAEQTTALARTPTPGPSKVSAPTMLPLARTFKAINTPTASVSRTALSTASGSDHSGLKLLCTAANLVTAGPSEADPFVSSKPLAPTKIMLKFGKGKMPVISNPVAEVSQPRITKKRKRTDTLFRQDSKFDEDLAPAAKKAKSTKAVSKETAQEQTSAEKVVNVRTIDISNNDQASASTEALEQQIEIKNGATLLAYLTFTGMKVAIDFAPTS